MSTINKINFKYSLNIFYFPIVLCRHLHNKIYSCSNNNMFEFYDFFFALQLRDKTKE